MTIVDGQDTGVNREGPGLIDRLKLFNAKERYWVVRQALGRFQPTSQFVDDAAQAAGVPKPNGYDEDSVYLAMDYHLNWLYAALGPWVPSPKKDFLFIENMELNSGSEFGTVMRDRRRLERWKKLPPGKAPFIATKASEPRALIENAQEDVDLLLAYTRPDGIVQIILIEAKCATTFDEGQLESKVVRLCGILDSAELVRRKIDVKFVLMSPPNSQRTETIKGRIDILRQHAKNAERASDSKGLPKYEELVPDQEGAAVRGWMPLNVRHLDERGFWVVEYGTGKNNESTPDRLIAGKEKKRWYWPEWRLTRRRRMAAEERT